MTVRALRRPRRQWILLLNPKRFGELVPRDGMMQRLKSRAVDFVLFALLHRGKVEQRMSKFIWYARRHMPMEPQCADSRL